MGPSEDRFFEGRGGVGESCGEGERGGDNCGDSDSLERVLGPNDCGEVAGGGVGGGECDLTRVGCGDGEEKNAEDLARVVSWTGFSEVWLPFVEGVLVGHALRKVKTSPACLWPKLMVSPSARNKVVATRFPFTKTPFTALWSSITNFLVLWS